MTVYTVNADSFGSFYQFVGFSGTDDTVIVNIGVNFSGTITIDSFDGDGENEEITYTLPPGWVLEQTSDSSTTTETPNYHSTSYFVRNASGDIVGVALFRGNDIHLACFTRGTAIRTARGEVLVEDLISGDLIWTEARGLQPIRWICQREVPATGDFAPIRICAGTLGADRDILVSPAHRMLIQGREVELLCGVPKALVAAKDMVNGTTILRDTTLKTVEYFHLLFDQHEVLEAHGTLSESFLPHPENVGDFHAKQREELFALFPELKFGGDGYTPAYPPLLAHEAAMLRL